MHGVDVEPSEVIGKRHDHVAVAVGGSTDDRVLVENAKRLADALGASLEAVHIETPERVSEAESTAVEALELAARLGATVTSVPATSVEDGLALYLENSPATDLVIGAGQLSRPFKRSPLGTALVSRCRALALHIYPVPHKDCRSQSSPAARSLTGHGMAAYLLAVGSVILTLAAAEFLNAFIPARSLDLPFLLPVIAIAARRGMGPASLAAALSVVAYNYFLLSPALTFDFKAPQNVVMAVALFGVAAYTSMVTGRVRARALLSDRSAQENAAVAAFAQRLTSDADWQNTGLTVCEQIGALFDLRSALFREIGGDLVLVAAVPGQPEMGPLDRAALDWCWANVHEAGAGTAELAAADWQFKPLATSLGVLAVLGLSRDDGRDPVRVDQKLLLSTLVAQAALAHERLRLQDAAAHTDMANRPLLPGAS